MTETPSVAVLGDVMTRSVHVVAPFTSLKTAARLLTENQVGALPVVNAEGEVVGVLSEADLIARIACAATTAPGTTAAAAMSTPAIVAPPDLPVRRAAELMHERNVRHLPVVDENGRLAGIVSRGDLLELFLRGDEDVKRRIENDLLPRLGWLDRETIAIAVDGGVVEVTGEVPRRSDVEALKRLLARVDGVVAVGISELLWHLDDLAVRAAALGLPVPPGT